MALMRWKAWTSIPRKNGGVIRSGEEFVAEENDPRCRHGRARLLGPAEAVRGPSPKVLAALAEAELVASMPSPVNPQPEVEARTEVVGDPEPEVEVEADLVADETPPEPVE